MNKLFLFVLLFLSLRTSAQTNIPLGKMIFDSTSYEFTLVDSIKNCDKNCAYNKAKVFIVDAFKSAKDVIQLDDKEMGRIIVKGVLTKDVKNSFGEVLAQDYIHFKISIDVKDSKFRIRITEIEHEAGVYNGASNKGSLSQTKMPGDVFGMGKKYWRNLKSDTRLQLSELINSFSSTMKKQIKISDF